MTEPMTPQFKAQMKRLGGLKFPPPDLLTHWEALRALPEGVLEAAVSRAQRTRVEFPTPVELCVDADMEAERIGLVEIDKRTPLAEPVTVELRGTAISALKAKLTVTDEWHYDCEDCNDGGMVSFWCGDTAPAKPWYFRRHCGRRSGHSDGHEWAGPCPCAETNPTIRRRKDARIKYAAEPVKVRRS